MRRLLNTLCILLSFNSFAYSECDNLYFLNFLAHVPHTPFIVSKQELSSQKLRENKEHLDSYIEALDYLAISGVEKYITKVFNGTYPTEITIGGRVHSLLDLAISNKASNKLLNTIFNSGISLTNFGILNLLSTRDIDESIKLIEKYSDNDLNQLLLLSNNKNYSITNFLLLQKNINSLKYIHGYLQNKINFVDNLYSGNLIDLDQFNIEDKLEIGQLFDIKEYNKRYIESTVEKNKNKEFIDNLKLDYSIYSLYYPCSKTIDWSSISIVGAKPISELKKILKDEKIDINSIDLSLIKEKKLASIVEEYILFMYMQQYYKNQSFRYLSDFALEVKNSTLPTDNSEEIILNAQGVTLQELNFILGNGQWIKSNSRFSLIRVSSYILRNRNFNIIRELVKHNDFVEDKLFGRNFTYYILRHSHDIVDYARFEKLLPKPISNIGMSIRDVNRIRSLFDNRFTKHIN